MIATALAVRFSNIHSAAQTQPPPQPEGAVITGVIQDERGQPVADVKVTLLSQSFSSSKLTQVDGKFEFRNLKPDQYRIIAEAARFRKAIIPITVARPDESITPPPIKLAASSLHVAVLDANNQPLGGVSLSLYGRDRGAAATPIERKTSDDSGDAYFGRLSPGSYQLTATRRGYEEYRNEVFISSDITTEFPLQLLVAPVISINEKAIARYSVPNLPSKNVQSIFQDSQGWMWFGTDKGVARFNGADFKSSTGTGTAYDHLAGEDVRSIAEDQNGVIWLATSHGLRRMAKNGSDSEIMFGGQDARHVSVDSRGNVWAATTKGAFRFDGKIFASFDQSRGLPSSDVRAIAEDNSGKIWIATASGVTVLDGDKLISLDRWGETPAGVERASQSRDDAAENITISDAQAVFVDQAGVVWLATSKGLFFFDGNRISTVAIDALRGSSGSAKAAPIAPVRAIGQDRIGRMWFALGSGGVLLYDTARGESQRLSFLDRDRVAAIFTGREGHVWFAGDNGVVNGDFYSFVNFTTSRGLSDNDVRAVVELPGGNNQSGLWFLTASGVSRMEGERFVPVERFRANV
ncbi:MAG TPA: two-component regulator propeller domain-containing protein, partial [Blastocatellia bacterium]|nr:two-component regulator propeller domain-containing protein [Blastocatellia bacterium]